jgi:hypothetical protein
VSHGPESNAGSLPTQADVSGGAVAGSTLSIAKFTLHLQRHGLSYAILALVLEQLGLISQISGAVGGMC